jgi:shikimate kinase
MIISLIGFMGCGKSSVGRRLSELLCCRFMDLDDVVEEVAGRSISEIFAKDGELGFRQRELKALKDTLCDSGRGKEIPMPTASAIHAIDNPDIQLQQISERGAAVLALGGGTVMTPECAELVKENTLCIYLRASIDTLVKHLSSEAAKRPLLAATDKSLHSRIEELMSQRTSTYEKTANIIIDTDGKSIEQICSEITNLI